MAARMVINPVVVVGGVRYPKVATIEDPGRSAQTGEFSTLVHSSIIGAGNIALSLVAGLDLSLLDADPEIVSLFEIADPSLGDIQTVLRRTPTEIGWSRGTVNRLRTRLQDRQAEDGDLNDASPLHDWANRLAATIAPGDVRGLNTTRRGA